MRGKKAEILEGGRRGMDEGEGRRKGEGEDRTPMTHSSSGCHWRGGGRGGKGGGAKGVSGTPGDWSRVEGGKRKRR